MKFESAPSRSWHEAWIDWALGLTPGVQLAVLGIIGLFLLWQVWRLLRPKRRLPCRWKRDPIPRGTALVRWQCSECGVHAFSQDGKAPKECKQRLKDAGL